MRNAHSSVTSRFTNNALFEAHLRNSILKNSSERWNMTVNLYVYPRIVEKSRRFGVREAPAGNSILQWARFRTQNLRRRPARRYWAAGALARVAAGFQRDNVLKYGIRLVWLGRYAYCGQVFFDFSVGFLNGSDIETM